MKRKDAVFGLHFDFHANEKNVMGTHMTEESIQEIIEIANPDFIQCDCKGHPGISSYPTTVGNRAAGYDKDILKIWRKVTKENDIPLFLHYSGVFDSKAVETHPEWGVTLDDGTLHPSATNLFCDYSEKLEIPQFCEIIDNYGVDGFWIDGDCWGVLRDRSPKMAEEFKKYSGLDYLPQKQGDKGFKEYLEFLRVLYRKYLSNYTSVIHKKYPDVTLISNWAYTSYMPEEITTDVSSLSGDAYGNNMLTLLRYESKYMAEQGMPWDLMSWGTVGRSADPSDPTGGAAVFRDFKSCEQLKQEAAMVLAHGGAFQIYYNQNSDGSVIGDKLERLKVTKGVSEFCHERKEYCLHGNQKSDIAIYYCTDSAYSIATEAFGFLDGTLNFQKGDVALLSSVGMTVDVISEHHLKNKPFDSYKLVVIPEWESVFNKDELIKYVENGGNVLVLGVKSCKFFENELGIAVKDIAENKVISIANSEIVGNIGHSVSFCEIENKSAEVIDTLTCGDETKPASVVKTVGKGKICGILFDTGIAYLNTNSIILSDFVKNTVNSLVSEKTVEIIGSRLAEATAYEKDGKLCIGLINVAGPHTDPSVLSIDEIPLVKEFTVKIKCGKPTKITREPSHESLPFTYENGYAAVKIKYLEIFDILVIE